MKKGEFLGVYGTLRKGERADLTSKSSWLDNQYLGADEINGLLYHLGAFPGLKLEAPAGIDFNPKAARVLIDVFYINDPSTAAVLDAYEGYHADNPESGLYDRAQVKTKRGRLVWVYLYNPSVLSDQLIETGDWKNPRLQVTRRIPKTN